MSGPGRIMSQDGRFDLTELLREAALEEGPRRERNVSQDDISALFAARGKRKQAGPGGADDA